MLEDYRDIGEEQGAVLNTVRREECWYGGGTGSCIEPSKERGVWDIRRNRKLGWPVWDIYITTV